MKTIKYILSFVVFASGLVTIFRALGFIPENPFNDGIVVLVVQLVLTFGISYALYRGAKNSK